MKYILSSNYGKLSNAGPKAKEDAEDILIKNNFEKLSLINSINNDNRNLFFSLFNQFLYTKYLRFSKTILKNSIIVIQHPLPGWRYLGKLISTREDLTTICIIHDIDSIRYEKKSKFEINFLKKFDYIIVHNVTMKNYLIKKFNFENSKLYVLEIFDYLIENKPTLHFSITRRLENKVVYAGNISNKASFLSKLKTNGSLKFFVYGSNPNQEILSNKDITYKGIFKPSNPPVFEDVSFGLVWDGDSSSILEGKLANYLNINNPHKASLYLARGLPIIVPSGSAIEKFVIEYKVGFSVSNINEIEQNIKKLTSKEYSIMEDNAKKLSNKITDGYFLENVIKKINVNL